MRELSLFADESGDKTNHDRYFLLTLVIHDQANSIAKMIDRYEDSLRRADLPNIAFHSEPLLNGHKEYEFLEIEQRKKMLSSFAALVRYLPIRYKTFIYKHSEFEDAEKLAERLKRDISGLLASHLEFFQEFDHVKVYYDNGQALVKQALDESVSHILSKQAIVKRRTTMTEYRLAQVADYLCTIELAAIKYASRENGSTYDKFFGSVGSFKKNWLKQARRKLID